MRVVLLGWLGHQVSCKPIDKRVFKVNDTFSFVKFICEAMARQLCHCCGDSLMPTLFCPTCGSKNSDAQQPLSPPIQVSTSQASSTASSSTAKTSSSKLKGLSIWIILVGFGLVFGLILKACWF